VGRARGEHWWGGNRLEAIEEGLEDVVEKLEKMDSKVGRDATVIFQGLDNGIFYEAESNPSPPKIRRGNTTWWESWRWQGGDRREALWITACQSG
jgi:hypothetical protein